MLKIFVAGHNGMVGSSILKKLSNKNKIFTANKSKLNLLNQDETLKYFKKKKFDQVFICAAKVGGIFANSKFPADFIYENLQIQNNCIISSYKTNVKRLLFLGSSCIYPKKSKIPINEKSLLTGKLEKSNEAYAIAKIAGIKMCQSFNDQFNTDYRAVMPTNLYGPNDNFDKFNSHVLPGLIKKIMNAKNSKKKNVSIWGTGNPKREFLHVDDFADACIKIMKISKKKYFDLTDKENQFINIGYGKEISIKLLAKLISNLVGFEGDILYDNSKPDGVYRKLIDSTKINKLKWKPKITLKKGIHSVIKNLEMS
jgi:GDP-L-fucose synthase